MRDNQNIDKTTIPAKWLRCNGQQLRKLAGAALAWLDHHRARVNSLNVFPVPDGDTGTNMLLTMQAAYGAIQDSQEMHVGKLAQALAYGALMGARGNSGVILSQIWRGIARSLKEKEAATAHDMAIALKEASDTAYKGVMRPVEGTILTVIREGSEEAGQAAEKSGDLRFLLERVLERCQQALERTPDLLPILKQAGVVDSGGQGLVFLLEGMLRYVNGQEGPELSRPEPPAKPLHLPAQALAVPEGGSLEFPYDVQFILRGQNLDVLTVRDTINNMGDSGVIVGDETTIKVHIHVKDPGQPISYGVSLGQILDVVVENMQLQMEEIVTAGEEQTRPVINETVLLRPGQIGVVAVASGNGFADIFRSLGAAAVVNGGQTNNPSTEEIFQAVEQIATEKVIILPNNKNIILAAEAARDLSHKEVMVVPTRTLPQGIAALLALNPDGDLAAVGETMLTAGRAIASGEITVATRSVTLDGVDVAEGDLIGLANGRLCASGRDLPQLLHQTLVTLALEERELLTLYYGQDVSGEEAQRVADLIAEQYPNVEMEMLAGGQPHYLYILGAE